jgi:predicted phosphodiesterase
MMRCRILSDLHLEFFPFVIPPLAHDKETVLVLAGDVGTIRREAELSAFLCAAARQFRAVIYVLGNHEYYHVRWPGALARLRAWALPANLHVLERDTVELDDVTFVGATLWTDFGCGDPRVMKRAWHGLNDFWAIRRAPAPDSRDQRHTFLPEHALADHRQSRAWLRQRLGALHAQHKKAVLVTHHGLAPGSIATKYQGDDLNGAFVSDLTGLITETCPALAIHGHVHDSFDYRVGDTRIVVNPRGYARHTLSQENRAFDPCLAVEV